MPQIRLRDDTNTLRTISRVRIRDATGVLRVVKQIRMRDAANVLRTVFVSLTASAPTPKNATGATSTITTTNETAVASGGTAPYTYLWRAFNNDTPTYNPDLISINSPTSATTTFSYSGLISGDSYSATFECVVTDALGSTAITNPVSVTITRT